MSNDDKVSKGFKGVVILLAVVLITGIFLKILGLI